MGILGKAVVIIGAGRGLGEAYALHTARSGACVAVNDVDGELAVAVADQIVGKDGLRTHRLPTAERCKLGYRQTPPRTG